MRLQELLRVAALLCLEVRVCGISTNESETTSERGLVLSLYFGRSAASGRERLASGLDSPIGSYNQSQVVLREGDNNASIADLAFRILD